MAGKTLVNGTAYTVKGGRTLVNGTGYSIKGGRTLVDGTGYDISFLSGILASDIAVGSSVYLMENGAAVEYLVVNQGRPADRYHTSCDGMWLLRKDLYEARVWSTNGLNSYKDSDIHSYLNDAFFNMFGATEQSAIKQVKIPFVNGNGAASVAYDEAGLDTKVFLLSCYEVGWTAMTDAFMPADGNCLSYFSGFSATDSRRIAYLNGEARNWWLRSPYAGNTINPYYVYTNGAYSSWYPNSLYGIRPALVLPSTAVFDETTMLLKGVA